MGIGERLEQRRLFVKVGEINSDRRAAPLH